MRIRDKLLLSVGVILAGGVAAGITYHLNFQLQHFRAERTRELRLERQIQDYLNAILRVSMGTFLLTREQEGLGQSLVDEARVTIESFQGAGLEHPAPEHPALQGDQLSSLRRIVVELLGRSDRARVQYQKIKARAGQYTPEERQIEEARLNALLAQIATLVGIADLKSSNINGYLVDYGERRNVEIDRLVAAAASAATLSIAVLLVALLVTAGAVRTLGAEQAKRAKISAHTEIEISGEAQTENCLTTFVWPAEPELPCTVRELVADVLPLLSREMALQDIRIENRTSGESPRILVDKAELRQVLFNLLLNAQQAFGENSSVERPRVIRLEVRSSESEVSIEITDTGLGIEPEDLPRIFDPLFTTKEPGSRTCLGLSVSCGIIERHGGSIDVKSDSGKGTSFTIRLPTFQEASHEDEG